VGTDPIVVRAEAAGAGEYPAVPVRRIGHKGADAIAPGNTLESFNAAVELGVDMIELDVLPMRDGRLVVAHDYVDAAGRDTLSLAEGLDAFTRPPLGDVEVDCDLKLPGGEEGLAEALGERDLFGRAMVSTMEISSLERLRGMEPRLRLGWTYPKVSRDWNSKRWARPGVLAALFAMRRRLPRIAERRLPRLDVQAMWVYWPLVTRRLVDTARSAGVDVIAWTVDELERMHRLRALRVDGICSNDPRLFAELDPG
jgi:glycerophosphoryl diester phosphodiesterase